MIVRNFIEKLSFSLTFLQNTCKCEIFFVSLHGYLMCIHWFWLVAKTIQKLSLLADFAHKTCQNKEKYVILADLAYKTCQNKEKYTVLADFMT